MTTLRIPRTSQPQTPVGIDWGNPITRGLVHAFIMQGGTGFDVAQGQPLSWVNTPGTRVNIDGPSSYAGPATAAGRKLSMSRITTLAECSILSVGRPVGTGSAATTVFGGCGSISSANPLLMIGAGSSATNLSFRVRSLSNINQEVVSGSSLLAPGKRIVALGSRSEGGNFQKLYADGIEVATAAATAIGATTFDTFSVNGLQRTTFGLQMESEVNTVMVWSRALSPMEAKSLSDNPWQIFQPVQRAIYVGEGAVGGDTYTLTAEAGSYTETGNAATLAFNRVFPADAGSYALTGNAATLAFNRTLTADQAAYALTGNAATLTYTPISGATYTLAAAAGDYTLTGSDATLAYNRALIADQGAYTLTGDAANLAVNRTLAANAGAYSLTGSDAALVAVRKLVADATAYALSAADATLTYTPISYPAIGRPASDTSNSGWTPSTGSDLYAMVDEVTPSDADYISASSVGAVCQMALNTTAYPGSASQVLKFRASSSTGNSVIVRLKEGATVIRSATQALTATDTEYSITLTSGEIAAITSGNLSVELESA